MTFPDKVCMVWVWREFFLEELLGQWRDQGQQNMGRRLFLTHGQLDLVFPHVFLYLPLTPEPVIAMFAR